MRLALLALLLACAAARAGEIEGQPRPVDGDSFNIEIRIFGIAAGARAAPWSLPRTLRQHSVLTEVRGGPAPTDTQVLAIRGDTVDCSGFLTTAVLVEIAFDPTISASTNT